MKYKHRSIIAITIVVLLSLMLTACDFLQFPTQQKPDKPVPEEQVKPETEDQEKPELPEPEVEIEPHPTIVGGAHLLPENPKADPLPKLIFSRMYVNKENHYVRFFAITNTTDTAINLNDYKLGQRKDLQTTFNNALPAITLEANSTVYVLNSKNIQILHTLFPTIKALEKVSAGGTVPAGKTNQYTDMMLYAGDKTYEIIENPRSLGMNSTNHAILAWDTVDIISINGAWPTSGTSAVRIYEPSTAKDYGWRILDQKSDVQSKIMDMHDNLVGGKYAAPTNPVGLNGKGGGSINISPSDPTDAETKKKQNTELGAPEYKGTDVLTEEQHWLISRPAYTLSFNHDRNIANWVSWHIDKSDRGGLSRPDKAFKNDPMIKPGWEPVMYFDYHYSDYGFDKGHMCPNADRNKDKQSQLDTFYMTNMIPQAGRNNQDAWADLENDIRENYVKADMEVYVVSGPSIENGGSTIEETNHKGGSWDKIVSHHDNGKTVTIDIPAYTWKVFIAIPNGSDDIKRINENPDGVVAYAVWMPNSDAKCTGKLYDEFKVSIDFVEQMTGYDFFPSLDDAAEENIESRNNQFDPVMNQAFNYEKTLLKKAV